MILKKLKAIKTVIKVASFFAVIIMLIVGVILILTKVGIIDPSEVQAASNISSANTTTGDFVQYYQNDYSDVSYGSGTIASCGCGPTSFAMVATKLLGRNITPKDAIEWCGNSYYVSGAGTSWSYFAAAAEHFQLNCTVRETTSIDDVVSALQKGNLVISSQGPGLFTNGGHFIVLASIDNNGGISVKDPNKSNAENKEHNGDAGYNNTTFTKEEINQAAKNYWIFE